MAEVRTAINITDGLTPAFKHMNSALGLIIKNFQTLQTATGKKVDTSALQDARKEIERANSALTNYKAQVGAAAGAQQQMNNVMNAGAASAGGLIGRVKSLAGAYAGYLGITSAMGFVKEALDLSDVQRNVETQLASVLSATGQTMQAFDELKSYAGEIQGKGIYGDEAMIAGAAEFATYMTDKDAIKKMMGTLSDYAMGMTGGGAVDSKQMTQFATQLGMAINGNMAGLSRKGFSMTDAQKEIMQNGTDMQKALVLEEIIGESWDGLYEKMSNTPQGKIIQLQNAIGDMKEVAGDSFYGVLATFADGFTSALPQVQNVITGLTNSLGLVVAALAKGAQIALWFANAVVENWGLIAPIVTAVAAAFVWEEMVLTYHSAAAGLAAATQWVLNSALLACPITWIVGGLYLIVGALNTFAGTSLSATGIIAGAFNVLWAGIQNGLAFVGNMFVGFCTFLANVFVNPLDAAYNLFADIWNGIVALVGQAVGQVLKLMSKIPGLGKLSPGGEFNVGSWMMTKRSIAGGVDNSSNYFGYKDYGSAAKAGYKWGAAASDSFKINPVNMGGVGGFGTPKAVDPAAEETAKNTGKMADKMDQNGEDIKLLREIAERDVINRFTTAEIKVDMTNNNTISNSMDIDGVVGLLGEKIYEQMAVAAEGVHF